MKIYYRSFLVQLLVRFGFSVFFYNFFILLVEVVVGYRDYVFEDLYVDSGYINNVEFQRESVQELFFVKEECVSDDDIQFYEDIVFEEGSEDEFVGDYDGGQMEFGSVEDEEDVE